MIFISLGSNCSVAYQLKIRNLKDNSYPFDWCKISMLQLIKVFDNNFKDYVDTLDIKKISHNHVSFFGDHSLILKNKYDIEFAHEIIKNEELEKFKNKLNYRINNFNSLHDQKIIFIRIELKPVKKFYSFYILKLIQLLEQYSNNFILKIIINTNVDFNDLPSNVYIHKFNEFSSNWQMNHLDWDSILSNSSFH
jgi:hypothetical protein